MNQIPNKSKSKIIQISYARDGQYGQKLYGLNDLGELYELNEFRGTVSWLYRIGSPKSQIELNDERLPAVGTELKAKKKPVKNAPTNSKGKEE